ncbi:hypothetical protein BU23DRAFT_533432 [Bimuria novae-zelandiae CBS 107.79]|uniref:NYN domain-containing protein n=1 Tax=Bimuria novae-zelandiae CBS 107.79 TaxID=1447943 RepID=A0A6A5VBG5_9PLEO|nr:hypothetical protein BU23DRAFT_533432 [Bimuria novae-zelandiae CBS 107.79]
MPSHPIDTGWGFNAVIDLIESDYDVASPTLSTASTVTPGDDTPERSVGFIAEPLPDAQYNPHLGDFTKVFGGLGIPLSDPAALVSPVDSEGPISSDDAILNEQSNSSSPEEPADLDSPLAGLTARQQKRARKKAAKKERKAQKDGRAMDVPEKTLNNMQPIQPSTRSNVGAKIRPTTPTQLVVPTIGSKPQPPNSIPHDDFTERQVKQIPKRPFLPLYEVKPKNGVRPQIPSSLRINHGLVPRTVQAGSVPRNQNEGSAPAYNLPISPPLTTPLYEPTLPPLNFGGRADAYLMPGPTYTNQTPYKVLSPTRFSTPVPLSATPGGAPKGLTIRSQTDRHLHFFNQLLANFPADARWLLSPMPLSNEESKVQGIHCFVDASNIMIGFKDMLRKYGQQHLDMSFDTLALLMERRRPVAKRISAGSHREAAPLPYVTKLVETSKAVGYENLVKEQVFIRREDSERKKFFKDVERMGWQKAMQMRSGLGSGSGSDSETGQPAASTPPSAPKWVEQGVDEILHLKMCQSVIDTEVPTTMVLATGDGNAAEFSDGFLANVERALKHGWTVELVSWKQQMSSGYKNKKFRAKWGDKFRVVELDDYLESLIDTA